METKKKEFTCADCKVMTCRNNEGKYPAACPTVAIDQEKLADVVKRMNEDETLSGITKAAAEVEGQFYGKICRVEETIEFYRRSGAKKVGIATCVGLLHETNLLTRIFDKCGVNYYAIGCKCGAVDKSEVGIPDENKLNRGAGHESMCNPVMQAEILNEQGTDFNIIMGLCVGHDMMFIMNSKAPVTTLIVKDRVLNHNPAAALYGSQGMYSRFK